MAELSKLKGGPSGRSVKGKAREGSIYMRHALPSNLRLQDEDDDLDDIEDDEELDDEFDEDDEESDEGEDEGGWQV